MKGGRGGEEEEREEGKERRGKAEREPWEGTRANLHCNRFDFIASAKLGS